MDRSVEDDGRRGVRSEDGWEGGSMRALLVESEPGIGGTVAAQLTAAGVDVRRCRPSGGADYACEGMPAGHGCPLDEAGTDAAIAVRSPSGGPVTHLEAGVGCALRLGVPVMVVGGTKGASYLPWVSGEAGDEDDLMPALEAAARRGRAQLCDPARRAAARVLGPAGDEVPIDVQVEYVEDRLRAEVQVAAPLDATARERIAVRVAGILRAKARWARAVDVSVIGTDHDAADTGRTDHA
jgi:hypothetical protein